MQVPRLLLSLIIALMLATSAQAEGSDEPAPHSGDSDQAETAPSGNETSSNETADSGNRTEPQTQPQNEPSSPSSGGSKFGLPEIELPGHIVIGGHGGPGLPPLNTGDPLCDIDELFCTCEPGPTNEAQQTNLNRGTIVVHPWIDPDYDYYVICVG